MGTWWTVLGAVLAIILVMLGGAFARWREWLTTEADASLMALSIRLLLPCLIFYTILRNPNFTPGNLLGPPLLGYGSVLLGLAVAWLWLRLPGRFTHLDEARARRTFLVCVSLFNYSYIPIPLIDALFHRDELTNAVLLLFVLGVELALWTAAMLVLAGKLGPGWWRRLLNAPSVALVVAVALNIAGLRIVNIGTKEVPEETLSFFGHAVAQAAFVVKTLQAFGAAFIPLSVILIGATAADQVMHAQWRRGSWQVGQACLLRLGVLPLLFLVVAWMLPRHMTELRRVIAVEAAMPCAMFPIVMARYYDGDPPTAVRCVLGTLAVSLVTIPLWLTAGLAWVGE
jgi:malate permease and related proteins